MRRDVRSRTYIRGHLSKCPGDFLQFFDRFVRFRLVEVDLLGNPTLQRFDVMKQLLSSFRVQHVQLDARRIRLEQFEDRRMHVRSVAEALLARELLFASARQRVQVVFHLSVFLGENFGRRLRIDLALELTDASKQSLCSVLQTVGDDHAVGVIVKGVLGEHDGLLKVDGQTELLSIVVDRHSWIGSSQRWHGILHGYGQLLWIEISAGADTELEANGGVAEGLVDHRHVVDAAEQEKCPFDGEDVLRTENDVDAWISRAVLTASGNGMPLSFCTVMLGVFSLFTGWHSMPMSSRPL